MDLTQTISSSTPQNTCIWLSLEKDQTLPYISYFAGSQSLTLQGHNLKHVEFFKYLGLLLSSDLSWTAHVESICSRVRKLLELLYRKSIYQYVEPHADPTPAVHISLVHRICQSSMESLLAVKYKHTGGCTEIYSQNVLQALGPGLLSSK